jgi:CTP synthase (UTP-ammonia lyase)
LKLLDADTVENMTDTNNPVVTPIACALPNRPPGSPKMFGTDPVEVVPGTRLRALVGNQTLSTDYFCNYGVNEEYAARFEQAGFRVSARGAKGETRAMELEGQRFYIATLFQPQLASTAERPHSVITAYIRECVAFANERAGRSAEASSA